MPPSCISVKIVVKMTSEDSINITCNIVSVHHVAQMIVLYIVMDISNFVSLAEALI